MQKISASGRNFEARDDTSSNPGFHDSLKSTENSTPAVKSWLGVFVLCAVFCILACAFVPYVGIQHDEALFSGPIEHDHPREYLLRAFKRDVPLMLLPYLGTAKTWLYALLFKLWEPSIWSVRLPVILIGAATLVVVFLLVRRMAGRFAALATCAVLATGPSFVLTTTFDWGPAAIQHLCWAAGLYLVIRGVDRDSAGRLGGGFLLLGLGMWDKALFIWMLSGAGVATLLLFPREVRRALTKRNVAAAVLGFIVGASPLILYNIRQPLKTFQGNTEFSLEGIRDKAELVKLTVEGASLFGYLVNEEWSKQSREPRNGVERASVGLRAAVGERRSSLLFYAAVAALALAPLWWRRWKKTVGFVLIAMLIAWLQMALNRPTGGGVHHVVLLWPLPHILIGIGVAAVVERAGRYRSACAAGLLSLLVMSNLLVVNQYFSQFVRFGAAGVWTDAVLTLSEHFRRDPTGVIITTDWGMFETVRLLNPAKTPMLIGDDHVNREPDQQSREGIEWLLSHEGARFVTHAPEFEVTQGATRRLLENTAALGYQPQVEAAIADSTGRPVFEVLRFTKIEPR
jgi:hypothetical protein